MALYALFLDILRLTAAGAGVMLIAFYLFKPYLENKEKLQLIELKKTISSQTLPLRLQAYERLLLLTDRINPSTLLLRLNAAAYPAAELRGLIISEVRNEFQHNITQQLYVSARAWQLVRRLKEDTLRLTNSIADTLPTDAGGLDLGKAILNHLSQLEHDPYDAAALLLKADADELF